MALSILVGLSVASYNISLSPDWCTRMKSTMLKGYFVLVLAILATGCSDDSGPGQPQPVGEINLMVSLSNAQVLGYDVTRAEVVLEPVESGKGHSKGLEKSITVAEMTIAGDDATVVINGLNGGRYSLTIRLFHGIPVLAQGTQFFTLADGANESLTITSVDWLILFPDLPRNILFVGNSLTAYNGGLGNFMADFVQAADPNLGVVSAQMAPGGYTLEMHWANSPYATRDSVGAESYDWVVFQGSPSNMVNVPESFNTYAGLFIDEVTNRGGKSALFIPPSYKDYPQHAETLVRACEDVAASNPALAIPISQAWYWVMHYRPDIELYHVDNSHPSKYGTYLDLCVLYASLFQRSPEGTDYLSDGSITIPIRNYLQLVAWNVTSDYYNWPGDKTRQGVVVKK